MDGALTENIRYMRAGKAADLDTVHDRRVYRAFEMLPGILSWSTLVLAVLLSWQAPAVAAVFIIAFDLYWLLRIVYFTVHLRAAYRRMREHERTDWLGRLRALSPEYVTVSDIDGWRGIYHVVVFPMYKEPLQLVRESFDALAASDYPRDRIIVVLAIEERAGEQARETARAIEKEYGDLFHTFYVTEHPADIAGELPGKGSNEAYALRQITREVVDPLGVSYEQVIVSCLDVDTVVRPRYFSCLTYHYLTTPQPARASYQPIPLYVNNIWSASPLSRVFSFSSTFWHTMNQERPDKLVTFSSHSLSLQALVDVGFQQTSVVSEDSRIFWQCLFYYDGEYRVVPLYYPIDMDAIVAERFSETLRNLYKQQRRWAYGVENIPYMLFGFLRNKKIGFARKARFSLELIEGNWSWATAPFLIFLLGWLPVVLGGTEFNNTLLSYNLPRLTGRIMTVATIGIITSVYFSMRVLPPRPPSYGRYRMVLVVLQWFLLPLVMIFFSAMPALDAQTKRMLGKYMGFWPTPKAR